MPCSTHTIGAVLRSFPPWAETGAVRPPKPPSRPAARAATRRLRGYRAHLRNSIFTGREDMKSCVKYYAETSTYPALSCSTSAAPLRRRTTARCQDAPARSGAALPGPRVAACVALGFSLNYATAATPESPRVGPYLRTQPLNSYGRLLPSHGAAPASPRALPVGNARARPARQRTKLKLPFTHECFLISSFDKAIYFSIFGTSEGATAVDDRRSGRPP